MANYFPYDTSITPADIERQVAHCLIRPLDFSQYEQLARYTQLLYRWNSRMNLTAVRDLKSFIGLHLAECLLCGQLVPSEVVTGLDFGSGAGLPGIPIKIVCPDAKITLGESQSKKAAFLREVVRELHLSDISVYMGRVQHMDTGELADLVTLRAVDKMAQALQEALPRIRLQGWCMVLTSRRSIESLVATLPQIEWGQPVAVPGTEQRVILSGRRLL